MITIVIAFVEIITTYAKYVILQEEWGGGDQSSLPIYKLFMLHRGLLCIPK